MSLCDRCGKTFGRNADLNKHIRKGKCLPKKENVLKTKKIFKSFMCELCGELFNSKCQLIKHRSKHDKNTGKTYLCLM